MSLENIVSLLKKMEEQFEQITGQHKYFDVRYKTLQELNKEVYKLQEKI